MTEPTNFEDRIEAQADLASFRHRHRHCAVLEGHARGLNLLGDFEQIRINRVAHAVVELPALGDRDVADAQRQRAAGDAGEDDAGDVEVVEQDARSFRPR